MSCMNALASGLTSLTDEDLDGWYGGAAGAVGDADVRGRGSAPCPITGAASGAVAGPRDGPVFGLVGAGGVILRGTIGCAGAWGVCLLASLSRHACLVSSFMCAQTRSAGMVDCARRA